MSSKRRLRRKGCAGKVAFASKDEAAKERGRLSRNSGYIGVIRTYRCKFCGMYHNGHQMRHVMPAKVRH